MKTPFTFYILPFPALLGEDRGKYKKGELRWRGGEAVFKGGGGGKGRAGSMLDWGGERERDSSSFGKASTALLSKLGEVRG